MEILRFREKDTVFKYGKHIFCIDNKICSYIYGNGYADGIRFTRLLAKKATKRIIKKAAKECGSGECEALTRMVARRLGKMLTQKAVDAYAAKKINLKKELDSLLGERKKGALRLP